MYLIPPPGRCWESCSLQHFAATGTRLFTLDTEFMSSVCTSCQVSAEQMSGSCPSLWVKEDGSQGPSRDHGLALLGEVPKQTMVLHTKAFMR